MQIVQLYECQNVLSVSVQLCLRVGQGARASGCSCLFYHSTDLCL